MDADSAPSAARTNLCYFRWGSCKCKPRKLRQSGVSPDASHFRFFENVQQMGIDSAVDGTQPCGIASAPSTEEGRTWDSR